MVKHRIVINFVSMIVSVTMTFIFIENPSKAMIGVDDNRCFVGSGGKKLPRLFIGTRECVIKYGNKTSVRGVLILGMERSEFVRDVSRIPIGYVIGSGYSVISDVEVRKKNQIDNGKTYMFLVSGKAYISEIRGMYGHFGVSKKGMVLISVDEVQKVLR